MEAMSELKKSRNLVARKETEVNPERLLFIDNLRWSMIILVVIMHLNVTYSSFGSWYYVEKRPLDILSYTLFGMYGSFIQAFFMGFLFLIAGYFIPRSFDKKGAGKFIADRLIRLGIPTLFYMLIIHPTVIWIMSSFNPSASTSPSLLSQYWHYISSFDFLSGSGPLWFAFALLIFSIIYALIRLIISKFKIAEPNIKPVSITHTHIIAVGGLISVLAFLIRLIQPIGIAIYNMQLCYFAQYIVLFILGIMAYRWNLLTSAPYSLGMKWFRIALQLGIPFWAVMMMGGGAMESMAAYNGGLYWQSAAYAFWESFFCVGVCLGLLVLFREKYNTQGKLSRFLSENAFGVYVFHTPILVSLSMALQSINVYPLLKMLLVSIIALPVCFGFSCLIRRIPWFKRIFS